MSSKKCKKEKKIKLVKKVKILKYLQKHIATGLLFHPATIVLLCSKHVFEIEVVVNITQI